jgi:molybdate transport system regulatory protein
MDMKAKLYLVDSDGEKFMGIGVLWLMEGIERQGSLRASAASMAISYSKAYAMVRNLEHQVGFPVVERKKGGAAHDGATLTPFGRDFLSLYRTFQQEAKDRIEEPFEVFKKSFKQLCDSYHEREEK